MTRKLLLSLLAASVMMSPLAFAQQQKVAPVMGAGSVAIDLPDSSAQSVTLDIVQGRFSDYSVGRITLTGNGIDFRNGTLQGLKADVLDGDFDNLPVNKLSLNTPAFSFNTLELLNNRTFLLSQPVNARVHLTISEANLNRFLTNPKTLGQIEKSIQKKTGGMKLLTFSNPHISLLSGNKVKLDVTGVLAQNMAIPMEMTGSLGLHAGQLKLNNLNLSSNGTQLPVPVDVAKVFEEKLNEMIDFKKLGKNAMVIQADSIKLNGHNLIIEGNATLTKLKFG